MRGKAWWVGRTMLGTLAAWSVVAAGVASGQTITTHEHAAHHQHASTEELPAGDFAPGSLYHLASTWTSADGEQLQLGALQGKARVLVMHYASCEYACPILLSILKNIEATLEPALREQVGFVTVSFDPERDTPQVLQAYAVNMGLDPAHWTLLCGSPEDTLELAVLLGVRYRKDAQGGFAHSNLLTVLNKQGEIVHRHNGLQQSVANTIAAIRRVATE